jgi:hypothetical protein
VHRKILICCPSNDGKNDNATTRSLFNIALECAVRGWQADLVFRLHDSVISRARNMLFSMFYFGDWSDMLFIDADIGCQPGSFSRLMDHPVELVGAAYPPRAKDMPFVVKPLPHGMLSFDQEQKTGLMEVEAVPTGFMRITRACAIKMVNGYGDKYYLDSTAPEGMPKCFNVFDFVHDGTCYWSEDYTFCRRFRDIGGKVWVDPFLEMTHVGSMVLKGSLLEDLKRINPQMGEPAPITQPVSLLDAAKSYLEAAE